MVWYEVGREGLEGHTCTQVDLCFLSAGVALLAQGQENPQEGSEVLSS